MKDTSVRVLDLIRWAWLVSVGWGPDKNDGGDLIMIPTAASKCKSGLLRAGRGPTTDKRMYASERSLYRGDRKYMIGRGVGWPNSLCMLFIPYAYSRWGGNSGSVWQILKHFGRHADFRHRICCFLPDLTSEESDKAAAASAAAENVVQSSSSNVIPRVTHNITKQATAKQAITAHAHTHTLFSDSCATCARLRTQPRREHKKKKKNETKSPRVSTPRSDPAIPSETYPLPSPHLPL